MEIYFGIVLVLSAIFLFWWALMCKVINGGLVGSFIYKVLSCYSCNSSKGNTLPSLAQLKKAQALYRSLNRKFVVSQILC